MSPGATFERVYLALRAQVIAGAFRPGQPLEPAVLATGLVASITPVRDALHRLVGERLVHTPRGDGFRMPIYTEAVLRDLYGWNLRLLLLALAAKSGPPAGAPAPLPSGLAQDPVAAAEEIVLAIARLAGSAEHLAAVRSLDGRLHAVRRVEAAIVDPRPELGQIAAALAAGEAAARRRLLAAYHRRRIAIVPRLLEQLQPCL